MTSLWAATAAPPPARSPLEGDLDVDVAIIGAGYTGLWTAFYLRDSGLNVAVIEAEQVGYGASGRNGGWVSGYFPISGARLTRLYGPQAASAMQQALYDTITEIGQVIMAAGIDCDWAHGGTLSLARTPRQLRLAAREQGFLAAAEAAARCHATRLLGATYSPRCAVLHPLKLVRGLARHATVYEHTRARSVAPGRVQTSRGEIRARHIIEATEAYTPGRVVVPIYSLMIATAPLPSSIWDEIGLAARETFTDYRRLVIYGQRTADGRIAFGGRGRPYHIGSRIEPSYELDGHIHGMLASTLVDLFPQLAGVEITHRWGGPVGVPRDWHPGVGLDPVTGIGWAGGYVGDGVAAANLAGRTLADLILGRDTSLTRLPWVNRKRRKWEPEPLRWLGINAGLHAVKILDRLRP